MQVTEYIMQQEKGGGGKNMWVRAERGDNAATVTDAEEEKSPNVTCTTTWRRKADVHYVKDVFSSYFKPAVMMHRFEGALNQNKGSLFSLFFFFF